VKVLDSSTEEKSNFDPIITPSSQESRLVYFGGIYVRERRSSSSAREGLKSKFLGRRLRLVGLVKIAGKTVVGM